QGASAMSETEPIAYVIDDDASVRKALTRLLAAAGIRVQAFASAEEFLDGPLVDTPACVILDVQMPGLGGFDLQDALARKDPALPIVFITGHGDIPMSVRAMKAGAVDFLAKPFHGDELLASVRQAIAK